MDSNIISKRNQRFMCVYGMLMHTVIYIFTHHCDLTRFFLSSNTQDAVFTQNRCLELKVPAVQPALAAVQGYLRVTGVLALSLGNPSVQGQASASPGPWGCAEPDDLIVY